MAIRTKQPWERGAMRRVGERRLSVRLSPEELEALRLEAQRRHTTVAVVARWALHQVLNIQADKGGVG